jgi:hypothetical protein
MILLIWVFDCNLGAKELAPFSFFYPEDNSYFYSVPKGKGEG